MYIFQWEKTVYPGTMFTVAQSIYTPSHPVLLHGHDGSVEVTWITKGEGWHLVNGTKNEIRTGDVIFLRETDVHTFQSKQNTRLVITNTAFPVEILEHLRRRYFQDDEDPCWQKGVYPRTKRLAKMELANLNARALELASQPPTRFHIERFLMNLFATETGAAGAAFPNGTPDWLQEACVRMGQPANYVGGAKVFYSLCGRSPEHATRMLQKYLGKSPTKFINEIRLSRSAQALAMTQLSIEEIAANNGFENLGYFYRLFRAHYKTTPHVYRRKCRATFN